MGVSRTHTFGEMGASKGQFYKKTLEGNKLNDELVDWETMDLSFLSSSEKFDAFLERKLSDQVQEINDPAQSAKEKLDLLDASNAAATHQTVVTKYEDKDWKIYARHFSLME